jgi:AraC-like DNA-binding protein
VTTIAEELGFGTVQRFSREFRRAFGLPPSRVRGRPRTDGM